MTSRFFCERKYFLILNEEIFVGVVRIVSEGGAKGVAKFSLCTFRNRVERRPSDFLYSFK